MISKNTEPTPANWSKHPNPNYRTFAEEVRKAGLRVFEYRGRFWYHGPAVEVSDIQEAIRATTVQVRWDNLGLNFVVYPR